MVNKLTPEQQQSNRLEATRFYVGKGLSPHQAAGWVGNEMVESGMDPDIYQIGFKSVTDPISGPGGYGLCQWTHPARKRALRDYSGRGGKLVGDLMTQLEFSWAEINSQGFAGALRALQRTTTAEEAAIVICEKYEMPGVSHLKRRIEWAQVALREYEEFMQGPPQ